MNQSDFLKVVLPFKDKVFRLAKRLLVSTEEAEDATQELYFKLWKSKEKIADYQNVEAFAMTMTKNYCYDRLKSKQASNLTLAHSNYLEKDTALDKKVEHQDSVSLVHQLIEKLPDQQKIIIQLRDIEEYDLEEICKMVDMKPIAVRVALSRARKTIREELIKKHNYGIC
ncbi:MAG: sigma-70 family RNA polymerase sigma factor [Flavobacteriia bacterium]|nr:sigma-70 family RNA polymerase sigma factor [Flavobacteriia bacterium]OIP48794.1 MAG: RNA polymerase subunit sigma-70 [Flavobacteriaceae bacterium CG2_30_31_66]PIV95514.1 MAG: RNA polymerase subunit sigma-70 [Flavobacteriaceae bacterium CG17_big_fil_post_rev_8_21_14_2_50_31_13]PIX14435.1 MAG: RNA polymerase subunit sigma-70 [Flavobacteriaceae bacterium CG_4_8_14_3_um_filter_31_8]PIY14223.1 MAG: RNA polymerase subunit sigma-70 [Flavobacteriaceae bacterium CG_4_10_14_3_um_filter_31_253]PIZ103